MGNLKGEEDLLAIPEGIEREENEGVIQARKIPETKTSPDIPYVERDNESVLSDDHSVKTESLEQVVEVRHKEELTYSWLPNGEVVTYPHIQSAFIIMKKMYLSAKNPLRGLLREQRKFMDNNSLRRSSINRASEDFEDYE
eukprot:TRINITY_DN16111_c0_g2_i2.p1 TRINITY_DN16111_c0_g2~~TRINITY_DN16111_c0_g2_i2.p1  ORF type:complete len:141 (+),score=33.71 TRINITY_DN16111_c0_g2_i2:337-759(+)